MTDDPRRSNEGGRRRGRWRRAARWALFVALVLVMAPFLFLLLLPFITNTAPVRRIAEGAVSDALSGAEVRIGTLRVAPLRKRLLVLEDVTLARPERPDEPVLTLRAAECSWRPLELRRGLLHVTRLTADGAELRTHREDGEWDLLSLLPPPVERTEPGLPRLPIRLQIDLLSVTDARVEAFDPDGLQVSVADLHLEGHADLRDLLEGEGSLRMSTGLVTLEAGAAALESQAGSHGFVRLANNGGRVQGTVGLGTAELAGRIGPLARVQPFPLEVALGGEADLAGGGIHRLDGYVRAGRFLDNRLALTPAGGSARGLELVNRCFLDLAALGEVLEDAGALPLAPAGTVSLTTRIAGALDLGEGLAGPLDVKNELEVSGVGDAAGWSEGVFGLIRQVVQVSLASTPAGLAHLEVLAGAASVGGEFGGGVSARAGGPFAALGLQATFPVTSRMDGDLSLSAGALEVKSPEFGDVRLPVEVGFGVRADNWYEPGRGALRLEKGRFRLGGLLPGGWLEGRAAAGFSDVAARGGLVLEAAEALELLEGLPAPVRERLPAVAGRGSLGASFGLEVAAFPSGARCAAVRVGGAADLGELGLRGDSLRVALAEARGVVGADVRLAGASVLHDIKIGLDGRLAGLEGHLLAAATGEPTASVALDRAEVDLRAGVSDPSAHGVTARMSAALKGAQAGLLRPDGSVLQLTPLDARFAGDVETRPRAGDLILSDVTLLVPGQLEAELSALHLTGMGAEEVAVRGRLGLTDLQGLAGRAVAALPEAFPERMPELAGRAEGTLEVRGKLPVVDELLAAAVGGRRLEVEWLPLRDFYRDRAPLEGEARLVVCDVAFQRGPAEAHGLAAEGNVQLRAGRAAGALELTVPAAHLLSSPVPLRDLRVDSSFSLRDFDVLEEAQLRVRGPGDAAEVVVALSADGLGMLEGMPTPAEILRGLSLKLRSTGSVRPDALAGLDAAGALAWKAEGRLEPGNYVVFRIEPDLRGVSGLFGGLMSVTGLAGQAVFEKRWDIVEAGREVPSLSRDLLAPTPSLPGESLRARLRDFATAVDELLSRPQQLVLESLSVGDTRLLESLRLELTARGAALNVPRIFLRPLGGRLAGRLSVEPAEGGRELRLGGEFDGVDLRLLLPTDLRSFRGDATLAGNLSASALVAPGVTDVRNPLKEISGRVELTHIGPEALDRLLLALDPTGEQPAVVRARGALRLGSPRRVTARLERGFLSLTIELRGVARGLISEYTIPRFNVADAFISPAVADIFRRLEVTLRALDALDADAIEITPDGSVRFVRRGQGHVAQEGRP